MPGPMPHAQRRRTNSPDRPPTATIARRQAKAPSASATWHPEARALYAAIKRSPQSEFFTAAEWAAAHLLAESVSVALLPQRVMTPRGELVEIAKAPDAPLINAWHRVMTSLLVFEPDRRKVGITLEREPEDEDHHDVSWIDEARLRLAGGAD